MGLILPQKVSATWTKSNYIYYINKGYVFSSYGDVFQINVLDLPKYSRTRVNVLCDFCNNEITLRYNGYLLLKTSKYCCPNCLSHMKKTYDENGNLYFVDIPYRNKQWLFNEYIVKDRSAPEIAKECGVALRTLRRWIEEFGLCNKEGSKTNFFTKELLYELYVVQMKSTNEIAFMYNLTDNTIAKLLRKYDIPILNHKDATSRYIKYKGGKEKLRKIMKQQNIRIETSCRIRGINKEEFDDFLTSVNMLIRSSSEYSEWRENVFIKDNYICQCCGHVGGKLQAHHIENFADNLEKRFDVNNGITLCFKCHSPTQKGSFHYIYGKSNNNRDQLDEYIKMHKSQTA